jgi:hypothetical protein
MLEVPRQLRRMWMWRGRITSVDGVAVAAVVVAAVVNEVTAADVISITVVSQLQ